MIFARRSTCSKCGTEEAGRAFAGFISRYPKDRRVPEALWLESRCVGEPGEVLTLLRSLTKRDAGSVFTFQAREAMGDLYLVRHDYEAAITELRKALTLAPAGPSASRARMALATALKASGKTPEAEAELRRALSSGTMEPGFSFPRLLLAELVFESQDYGRALRGFSDLVPLAPASVRPYLLWRCGQVSQRRGDLEGERRYWQALADSFPRTVRAREVRPELEALRISQPPAPSEMRDPGPKSQVIPGDGTQIRSDRFTVQVGAYSRRESAEARARELTSKGFQASVAPQARSPEATVYRVWVGSFDTSTEARAMMEQLGRDENLTGAFVTRRENQTEGKQ